MAFVCGPEAAAGEAAAAATCGPRCGERRVQRERGGHPEPCALCSATSVRSRQTAGKKKRYIWLSDLAIFLF